jgi:hypothetical protein
MGLNRCLTLLINQNNNYGLNGYNPVIQLYNNIYFSLWQYFTNKTC